jgi:uncharacterized protein YjiS (DUF1127 family)
LEVFENFLEELNYDAVRIRQNSTSFRSRAPDPQTILEVAMHDTPALASVPHQVARPATPVGPGDVSRWHQRLSTLPSTIATWRWRIHFRWELEQKSKASPHLIEDIGLTRREVEAEIAKPFWQA